MTEQEILKMAADAGFSAALFPTAEIPVDAKYRAFCEENRCGNYGANYACPPDCGTPEEMHHRLLTADQALVLQSVRDIPGYGTPEVLTARSQHTAAIRRFMTDLRRLGYDVFGVGYGGCSLCDPCRRKQNQPCAFPDLCMSCLSAYCVDAALLAERCGLAFDWNPRKLYLFGMIVFRHADVSGV